MSASRPSGWITALVPSSADAAPSKTLPIQVTDLKAAVRARGLTGTPIGVPAGRYLVTATSPDGRQWASCEAVEVVAGEMQMVELQAEAPHAPAQRTARGAGSVTSEAASVNEDAGRSAGSRSPRGGAGGERRSPFAVWTGHWLGHWVGAEASTPVRPRSLRRVQHQGAPTGEAFELAPGGDADIVIEVFEGPRASYFAVPFDGDPRRSTSVRIVLDAEGRSAVRFAFGSADIDDLLEFVIGGAAESARTISAAIVRQAEDLALDKSQSPLLAVVGSYVLLRANELDGLDRWTGRLLDVAGDAMPDAQVLHAETLARLGRHQQAVKVLSMQTRPRMPWFRSGVGYLEQRLELYLKLAQAGSASLSLSESQRKLFAAVLGGINRVSWSLDETTSFCAYRRLPLLN
jgi:hypothetical protein